MREEKGRKWCESKILCMCEIIQVKMVRVSQILSVCVIIVSRSGLSFSHLSLHLALLSTSSLPFLLSTFWAPMESMFDFAGRKCSFGVQASLSRVKDVLERRKNKTEESIRRTHTYTHMRRKHTYTHKHTEITLSSVHIPNRSIHINVLVCRQAKVAGRESHGCG